MTAGDPTASPTPADDPVRFQRAADSLPKLTRAVLLLSAIDDMPYGDISLRCGISEDEVRVRLADALVELSRAMRGPLPLTGRVRLALRPWRSMWARARAREADCRLARWLPLSPDALRRSPIDHVAHFYERLRRTG